MEAIFRCKSEYTKDLVQEFYEYCCFKKPSSLIIHGICALLLALWVYLRLSGREMGYIIPGAIFTYYVLMSLAYYISVRSFMSRSSEVTHSGLIRTETLAFPDCIKYMNGAGEPAEIEYAEIKKVFCTRNIIAIQTRQGLIYMLQKSGFKLGTAEGFLDFLRSKGAYKPAGKK